MFSKVTYCKTIAIEQLDCPDKSFVLGIYYYINKFFLDVLQFQLSSWQHNEKITGKQKVSEGQHIL